MKTEGELQRRAVAWAKGLAWLPWLGMAACLAGDAAGSARICREVVRAARPDRCCMPIPLMTAWRCSRSCAALRHLPRRADRLCWLPFVLSHRHVRARLPRAGLQLLSLRRYWTG